MISSNSDASGKNKVEQEVNIDEILNDLKKDIRNIYKDTTD